MNNGRKIANSVFDIVIDNVITLKGSTQEEKNIDKRVL